MALTTPRVFQAVIEYPPYSNNAIHARSRHGIVLTRSAEKWAQDMGLLLKREGLRPLPPGMYWIGIQLQITSHMDCDSPTELAVNTIKRLLAVDDEFVGDSRSLKTHATRTMRLMTVQVETTPVSSWEEWNQLTEQRHGFLMGGS